VKELLRIRRFIKIRGWIYSGLSVVVCAGLATTIILGILCGFGALGVIGGGAALKVANLENQIRKLGCACVL
jgi:hypothetical protein